MKKIFIVVIVLVLIVVALFFFRTGKKAEAPTTESPKVNLDQGENTSSLEENTNNLKEFIISGQNFFFSPSSITVKKGDRVKITFQNTSGFHDFVIDEYGVASKQAQSPATEILEFTADKIGSFEYYCSVGTHRAMGMKGILQVE